MDHISISLNTSQPVVADGRGRVGRLLHAQDTTLACLQPSHMCLHLDNGRLLVDSLRLSVKHDRKEQGGPS